MSLLGAVTAAAVFAMAFPGIGAWPLAVLAPLPLGWLAVRPGRPVWTLVAVYLAHVAMWLGLERWLVDVTAVGYPMLAAYLALYPAAFVWLLRRMRRHPRLGRLPLALLVPVLWVGLECLRGRVVLGGYPWYYLAHPLVELPILAQSADLVGACGVCFQAGAIAGAVLDLVTIAGGRVARAAALSGAAAVAALVAGDVAYGAWRLGQSEPIRPGPRAIVIQTDLPQSNKVFWTPEEQARDLPTFIDLTRWSCAAASEPLDLVVWPETMLPGVGLEPDTLGVLRDLGDHVRHMVVWQDAIVDLQRELGIPILAGSLAWVGPYREEDETGARWRWRHEYNSAYLIGADPPLQRYDKVSLTPFGETMPLISRWPWLEERLLAIGAEGMEFNLSAAETPRLLDLAAGSGTPVRLATPICFEVTVTPLCRAMAYAKGAKVADAFVNLSNDGWFGASVPGRKRHLQIARFRCIENRLPMVRAVNTGLSASIDSAGRIQVVSGPRTASSLMAELSLDGRSTVYGRIGDALAWICLAALVLGAAASFLGLFSTRTASSRH